MNKWDATHMQVRSRLVAKEFKWLGPFLAGTFAATPPLEALRYCLSFMATVHRVNGRRVELKMLVIDVSRAHFHPYASREVYIEVPPEDPEASGDQVGMLLRTMYGTRDAAAHFDEFCTGLIVQAGYIGIIFSLRLPTSVTALHRLEAWR